ncbi:Uma2 family endonuclease [Anatilimnocola sp. NA78]|uniref:Uma2 family endonuclease n=1 Tax=Anatilimnocola sp. NA78 TaxID=3415683 RepID=UPI003CE56535
MTVLVCDPYAEAEMLADRRAKGLDRFDEVWDGVYVMAPLPEYYHQEIVGDLQTCLAMVLRQQGLGRVVPGCNVSDRQTDWTKNYRCPDVVVYLNSTTARFHGTHWEGGPDFAIEVVSPNDRTWDKLDFYAKIGTRELLIIDRDPWEITLLRLEADKLTESGRSNLTNGQELLSQTIPFSFRLVSRND